MASGVEAQMVHDRSLRFMGTVFPWDVAPAPEKLLETSYLITVTLRIDSEAADNWNDQLCALALANQAMRLPCLIQIEMAKDASLRAQVPPYRGDTLGQALLQLAVDLGRHDVSFGGDAGKGLSLRIEGPGENQTVWLRSSGWVAQLAEGYVGPSAGTLNPIGAYTAAGLGMAEVIRAWARCTANLGYGLPRPGFYEDAAPTGNALINFWRPQREDDPGPSVRHIKLPLIDWVGAGAVTQAALAVLVGLGSPLHGRIFDPKDLDLPDLNRSLLSFRKDIGKPKTEVVSQQLQSPSLRPHQVRYPKGEGTLDSKEQIRWIVCGADDINVRADCQKLWPNKLIVGSTENQFARVSWHAPKSDSFCGACLISEQTELPDGPIPTIAPTSSLAGVAVAAVICRLTLDQVVEPCLDLLTLRMDSPFGIIETRPMPINGCRVCGGSSRLILQG